MVQYGKALEGLKARRPLVHTITNPVSINDCANILLACGASPIMAADPVEVAEIAAACDSLVLNMGTPGPQRVEALVIAGKSANRHGKPVVFDPVGVGASSFRRESAARILEEVTVSVIRGNASEIEALYRGNTAARGVDSHQDTGDPLEQARELAVRYRCVVVVSGKADLITDGDKALLVHNGHRDMSRITGTGCMLSALTGAFCGSGKDILASATAAAAMMGLCGEQAAQATLEKREGTGSMRMRLIDAASLMLPEELEAGAGVERIL